MLRYAIEVFKKLEQEKGKDLIINNRTLPKDATYVKINKDNSIEILNITGEDDDRINPLYKYFCQVDYLSALITMDKPVDSKKTIHSNNYMSFSIKKESLKPKNEGGKGEEQILDRVEAYYKTIQEMTPRDGKKKVDAEKLKMYDSLDVKLLDIDEEALMRNKAWIKNNLFELRNHPEYKENKGYLKIFFEDSIDRYENENVRYSTLKIFNKNDYNTYIEDVLYGVPNTNFMLNENKPSLTMKSRLVEYPTLLTLEDAFLHKRFYDFLMNYASQGERYIYMDECGFYTRKEVPNKDTFSGYMFRIQKGTEVEIHAMSPVSGLDFNLKKPFRIINILDLDISKEGSLIYEKIYERWKLESSIDNVLFYNSLRNNYFAEIKKIKIPKAVSKQAVIQLRGAIFEWFYLGKDIRAYKLLKNNFVEILKCSLSEGNFNKAKEQYNMIYSLINYFEMEECNMENDIRNIKMELRNKVNNADTLSIESDVEYYFAVGQVAKYLIGLKNGKSVMQSELNMITNCKKNTRLMIALERMHKNYRHSIYSNYNRFNNLYAMVLAYTPKSEKVDSLAVLGGYLNSSILKKNSDDDKSDDAEI